jgi:enterobactin synthetase component F
MNVINNANAVARIELPLTTAQRGLWIGHKINPATSLKLAEALELFGAVDPSLLMLASERVACEFDNVRVRIVEQQGMPMQVVDAHYRHEMPYIDLSAEPEPRQELDRWIAMELARREDLATGPLWTCALFRLGDEHYLWLQMVNHIVMDGYAGGMVAKRLSEIYSALLAGVEPSETTAGPLSGLVELEQTYRASDRYQRDRDYWMRQLANPPPSVTLSQRQGGSRGGLLRGSGYLSDANVCRLRELGRAHGASLPQVLIALVAAYYHRVTGVDDLIFGMPVTGRVNARYRNTPGMVANAVFIRLAMQPEQPFHSLFAQVSSTVKQALRHQQYRYEDIRRDLGLIGLDQQLSRLAVNVEAFDYALDFGGARAVPNNLSNGSAEDLTIFFYERGNGDPLRFDLDVNPELYSAEEIDAHCRRIERLAEQILHDAGQPLGQIDLIDPRERQRLLHDWNATELSLPEPASLLHWFEQRVAANPQQLLVHYGDRHLDYQQLYQRSGQLAAQWIADGIRPGDVVAVALPRSEQLLVVLLAVMWTGAAYLPLDPHGPLERNQHMLLDADAVALVCEPEVRERCLIGGVAWLDSKADAALPIPAVRATAEMTAYVLFTSGSTGRPKGVAVSHRNLANFLYSMQQELALGQADRVLALTTATFDIAGLEMYLPLLTGSAVVIADAALARDPLALAALLKRERINVMQATPSQWRILLANQQADLSGLHALVGGEALSGEWAVRLLQRVAKVTQLYGPTETTVWSTIMPLTTADAALAPPIGRPIANTQVYVLDAAQRLLPTGAIGELYIGGTGVAKGYCGQPKLSRERFLPDPYREGGRIYRTGDLARWREDGVLEFIGRADGQLKIRGHRIEPGEIEATLVRHPALADVVVVGHAEGAGPLQLVAYVVAAADMAMPSSEALRGYLHGLLPEAMVPSQFVALEALPLTPNGKLNRKALPAPGKLTVQGPGYVPARDALEQKMVELWQSLLGVERIGVHDNFFELGGDSLRAAELMAQVPGRFGSELPLGSLFQSATIAGLVDTLKRAGHGSCSVNHDPLASLLHLREGEAGQATLFCIHPVVGLGWSYTSLLGHLDAAWPVCVLQSPALRTPQLLANSIEELAASYLDMIRALQPHGPYRLLGWSLGGLIAHAAAVQLRDQGEQVELLAMLDSYPYLHSAEDMNEAERVQMAVRFLGLRPAPGRPQPVNTEQMAELVCDHYGLLTLPLVQQLLQDEPGLLGNIGALIHRHLDMARAYRPQNLDVDLLFVEAAVRAPVDMSLVMDYRPEAWRRHVRSLRSVAIDSDHQTLLDPLHAPKIACAVRQYWQARSRHTAVADKAEVYSQWQVEYV